MGNRPCEVWIKLERLRDELVSNTIKGSSEGRQASCSRIIFSALLNRYGRNHISHCQRVFALVNYGLAEGGFLCLVGQRRLHRVWYIARGLRHFPHDKSEIRCGDQRGGVGVDIPLLCAQQTVCRFISGGNGIHTMTVSLKGSIFQSPWRYWPDGGPPGVVQTQSAVCWPIHCSLFIHYALYR